MKGLLSYATAAMLMAPVLAGPILETRTGGNNRDRCNHDNPFKDVTQYTNKVYAKKVEATIKSFKKKRDAQGVAGAKALQKIPTFIWLSFIKDIKDLEPHLKDARHVQKKTKQKQIVPIVIYNLPERDCSAAASAGEITVANGGLNKYKKDFIDPIVKILKKYSDLEFAIVLEPDSLPNIVTNLGVEKCQIAAPLYKQGIAYAISQLQDKNFNLYIDIGHSNWLGWTGNLEPTADLLAEVRQLAGQRTRRFRGYATNTSNYNAYNSTIPDPIYGPGPDNAQWNEWRFVTALTPFLEARGLPHKFIVDQGRSGQQNIRLQGGHWCNIDDAGFGTRPTIKTNDCNVDALVWIKPGGESDGTSDSSAARFDENCVSPDAFIPSPEAGEWNNDYVEMLIKNAVPPLA
ncbi:Exoglucanase-6A [Dactylella cylindrospora]|nr:Exoglucanase-6A [Dactylella cylindrospora]